MKHLVVGSWQTVQRRLVGEPRPITGCVTSVLEQLLASIAPPPHILDHYSLHNTPYCLSLSQPFTSRKRYLLVLQHRVFDNSLSDNYLKKYSEIQSNVLVFISFKFHTRIILNTNIVLSYIYGYDNEIILCFIFQKYLFILQYHINHIFLNVSYR